MTLRVLVVEDDPLLAFDLADRLRDCDFTIVGPAATVAEALRLIEEAGCDVAVIDVNLGHETAAPVAARLRSRSLPFVALSGYSANQYPSEFAGAPKLTKPVDDKSLMAAIRQCMSACA